MRLIEHLSGTAGKPSTKNPGAPRRPLTLALIAATALGIYLCYLLALPFLPALTWAMAMAVLFAPFHRWLESKSNHPNQTAAISVLLVGLIVTVPMTFIAQRLIMESARGAELIKAKVDAGDWRRAIETQPRLAPLADWIERKVDLPASLNALTAGLSKVAGAFLKGSVRQAIGICLTFYLLFFFLRDRAAVLQAVQTLSPLSVEETDRLCRRVADTIYATVFGTLAVAAVQGCLGGLMFWWLGLPAPLLWGVVMAVLAAVPMVGAFVVWLPAALFLTSEGNWGKALLLTAWGMLIIGTMDNLLRPLLIGNRLKLHTLLAFMSAVGGILLFGPCGLILGPVVLTITMVLLEIWRERALPKPEGAPTNTLPLPSG